MTRPLAAALLAAALLLTGCGDDDDPPDTTGDSVTENQTDEAPGQDKDKLEEEPTPSP
jgi:PBP1b-binding outer membrane lipoprotein LpoB